MNKVKAVLRKVQRIAQRALGVPSLVIYSSQYPDGQLIGTPAQIGAFSFIDYGGGVEIGENVKIGYGVIILSASTITGSKKEKVIRKPVKIGDDVEIGSNAVILPGITIGSSSTIGAGAVVTRDIPPNSIAVGVPAKVVKNKARDQK